MEQPTMGLLEDFFRLLGFYEGVEICHWDMTDKNLHVTLRISDPKSIVRLRPD
ncbi:MAG: hypothetical protein LBO00_04600 [Zoogloeaceae bacterium]|nr:hypothetical protein [Zoogloeaceae bacterium]